jgi:hypothetical protein
MEGVRGGERVWFWTFEVVGVRREVRTTVYPHYSSAQVSDPLKPSRRVRCKML